MSVSAIKLASTCFQFFFIKKGVFIMKKKLALFGCLFFLFINFALASTTPASLSMHYGKPIVTQHEQAVSNIDFGPIVITNCSGETANVFAWFTDGSFKSMPIYNNYPENVISIDNPYPYVLIEVDALDGTVLFRPSKMFPGQHINIGCDAVFKKGSKPVVAIQ